MQGYVGPSKEELRKKNVTVVKQETEKEAWIALRRYFDGAGNGQEAKVACVVVGTLAKEEQSKNNARQLDIIEKRLALSKGN